MVIGSKVLLTCTCRLGFVPHSNGGSLRVCGRSRGRISWGEIDFICSYDCKIDFRSVVMIANSIWSISEIMFGFYLHRLRRLSLTCLAKLSSLFSFEIVTRL